MLFWAMLALVQDAPVTLPPSSKWQVDHNEASCFVAREFGAGSAKVALAFRLIPILKSHEVMLIGDASASWRAGELILTSMPSGAQIKRAAALSKTADGRPVLTAALDETDLAAIAHEPQLMLARPGSAALSASAVDKAFAAAKTCQDELVRSWGIDPANAALKAKPINPTSWVTDNDYPAAAFRARAQGVVSFRLTVGVKGEVARCGVLISSGNQQLDEAVCRNMEARGRFTPATTADGTPVASLFVSKFTWKIP